jgi:type I restriction enzyme S subunit
MESLIKKAVLAIELIQERRTALISAAVTGKIDVRNWQAPKSSSTNNKEDAA